MKIKKILAAVAASTLMLSAMAINASAAGSTVVDFEDGKMTGISMKTDDGGDVSVLSVVDFNGSKMLKVDVQDSSLVPKVYFDLNTIVGDDKFDKIETISMDIIFESKDGKTAVGWAGGAIGTQGGETKTPAWGDTAFELPADSGQYAAEDGSVTGTVTNSYTIERKFLLDQKYLVNGTANTHMLLMRWASEVPYNMYVDNVKFLDKDGNAIEIALAGSSTDKPATDKPATDDTKVPVTGNAGVAGLVVIAALATAGVVISKRK